jgi:hypothetical protein
MEAHTLAELLLPAFISNLLDTDIVTSMDNLVDKPSVQALAMGGKLAFLVRQSSSRGKIPLAILPGEALLTSFLDAPFFVIALWVIGTALAVQLALLG